MIFNSENMRSSFKERGYSYGQIDEGQIGSLQFHIKTQLRMFSKDNPEYKMTLRSLRKNDTKFSDSGQLIECYFMVNGPNFKRREAISFNKDGFIGFGGALSSKNTEPFYKAL